MARVRRALSRAYDKAKRHKCRQQYAGDLPDWLLRKESVFGKNISVFVRPKSDLQRCHIASAREAYRDRRGRRNAVRQAGEK
jgi:hypothetical protein